MIRLQGFRPKAAVVRPVIAALMASAITFVAVYSFFTIYPPNVHSQPAAPPTPTPGMHCDFVIPPEVTEMDGKTNWSVIEPGSTVCFEAGDRPALSLENFEGTPKLPIRFVNHEGQVVIHGDSDGYAGVHLENSAHVLFTGTGVSEQCGAAYPEDDQECGFVITGGTRGLVGSGTGYVEVSHIEVRDPDNVGIAFRGGNGVHRNDWTQFDTYLHHNLVRDTGTEGFYVGSSHYTEGDDPLLEGVEIHHNLLLRIGWDGIQVGSATKGCTIHHNVIAGSGLANESAQSTGIMNNPGSVCDIYNNLVIKSMSAGIFVQGNGGNRIYNNVVIQPGQAQDAKGDGIVISKGTNQGNSIFLWNNTVIQPGRHGITFRNNEGSNNLIQDNMIIGPVGIQGDQPAAYINADPEEITIVDNFTAEAIPD